LVDVGGVACCIETYAICCCGLSKMSLISVIWALDEYADAIFIDFFKTNPLSKPVQIWYGFVMVSSYLHLG
jgi:hypothetical protein